MNKKIIKIINKKNISKIVINRNSKNIAKILDKYCDIVLVGDSMANVLYGHENTHKISLETIINHTISVKKGIKKSLLVVDMPKGTYSTKNNARKNAKLIMRLTKCDAVKIESNKENYKVIKDLTKNKIPVMGHIGYTPQFKKKFSVQGDTKKKSNKLVKEALLIEKAGAFSIVLECLTANTSKLITRGHSDNRNRSSSNCDGQILVTDDMLGLSDFIKIC